MSFATQAVVVGAITAIGGLVAANWDQVKDTILDLPADVVRLAFGLRTSHHHHPHGDEQAFSAERADADALATISSELRSLSSLIYQHSTGHHKHHAHINHHPPGWFQYYLVDIKRAGVVLGLVCCIGSIAYLRQWKWTDMMFASRAGLGEMEGSVNAEITSLTNAMEEARAHLARQMTELERDVRDDLDSSRVALQQDIDNTRGAIEEMSESVRRLHESLGDVTAQIEFADRRQAYAQRAIQLMCQVVVEAMPDTRRSSQIRDFAVEEIAPPPPPQVSRSISAPPRIVDRVATMANWLTGRG